MAVTKATVADLIQCNRVLHEAKTHPVSLMVLPIQPEHVTLCAFSDASFMSSRHSTGHQGTLVFATTPEILENKKAVVAPIAWSSKKVPRVVGSTLSAEAAALSNTVDRLLWLRMLWAWIQNPDCEWSNPEAVLSQENKSAVVTDCRSMYDILTRTAVPSCSEHRTTIECLLIRERLKANCDVRWVSSQAMLADCLTKTMDSTTLRECLRTGAYSLFDEDQILKQRADSRQRLKWVKDQKMELSSEESPGKIPTNETINWTVSNSDKNEPHDFWVNGPGNQVRRIHVRPRTCRFVPIGVTGCPARISELGSSRETRIRGSKPERDFWTGTRGASRFPYSWTGETVFFRREMNDRSVGKEKVTIPKEKVC